jgi:ring-1,2-phenylacetyl-CoA epoxidase subunit PaaD
VVSADTAPSPAVVEPIVLAVEDPELPHVTIGELGMVRSVTIDEANGIEVVLTPTYTGCPATEQIRDDVVSALAESGHSATVRFAMSPPWTTDWITETGRRKLREAGITPPGHLGPSTVSVTLRQTDPTCPRCGSHESRLVSEFGGTACKSSHVCTTCLEPFERFKAI